MTDETFPHTLRGAPTGRGIAYAKWLFAYLLRPTNSTDARMNAKTVQYINRIDKLLSKPEKWTKGAFARDTKGKRVSPTSRTARCWCLIGAICKAVPNEDHMKVLLAFSTVLVQRGVEEPIVWRYNDGGGIDFAFMKQWISDAREVAKDS